MEYEMQEFKNNLFFVLVCEKFVLFLGLVQLFKRTSIEKPSDEHQINV